MSLQDRNLLYPSLMNKTNKCVHSPLLIKAGHQFYIKLTLNLHDFKNLTSLRNSNKAGFVCCAYYTNRTCRIDQQYAYSMRTFNTTRFNPRQIIKKNNILMTLPDAIPSITMRIVRFEISNSRIIFYRSCRFLIDPFLIWNNNWARQ